MSKLQDVSCTEAAQALGLSPLATLALRVSLMILRRTISVPEGRCLAVSIVSSKLTISVSRVRRSGSSRTRTMKCSDAPASGFTETTATAIDRQAPAVLSSDGTTDRLSNAAYPSATY